LRCSNHAISLQEVANYIRHVDAPPQPGRSGSSSSRSSQAGLLEEIPVNHKIWGLTWLMEQMLTQITYNMEYSYHARYDGDMKWTVEFKKGEF